MSSGSSIEWTEATWNPVSGCTRVSAGCDHCYAVTMTHRLEGMGQAKYAGLTVLNRRGERHFNGKVRTVPEALTIPLRWRKPRLVFVNSMSDLFHRDVPFEFIDRVFAVMALCPQHTFQVLTKRPERMADYLNTSDRKYSVHAAMERMCSTLDDGTIPAKLDPLNGRKFIVPRKAWAQAPAFPTGMDWPLPNCWLGTSVENQQAADERIPHLLRCPAAVRFLSCEPLLGAVDLSRVIIGVDRTASPLTGETRTLHVVEGAGPRIDWVICGGESGPGARPMHPDWVRSLRDQCQHAGVPFFFEQWGAWARWEPKFPARGVRHMRDDGTLHHEPMGAGARGEPIVCVGKKRAGRLLDGREWNEMPMASETPVARLAAEGESQ